MVSQEVINDRTELISLKQATKLLGISVTTIYRYEKKGLIQPYRTIGGHRRYKFDELIRFREYVMTSDFSRPGRKKTVNE